ncbi:aminodeoxychorismate synthase component I [Luedemannella helvata]|uniref:aminodeoxychorismate synthase n=1 Tax=Luedemannella helvata TaxID=349315 RepID=A0ABP4X1B6_9ACTN
MRTLLVDNYDSFTYNLFHYLAEVNGEEPEVVVNDDPRWQPAHLADFDNVVLSPGPGHPEKSADFGLCRQILADGDLPVLGVCLGHQGIAAVAGARVGRVSPWHGRVCAIRHDGSELFAGLPSPFDAVRYHSLAVADLPPALAATAWAPDGTIMALRHRTRPRWGVQFHPESIGSAYGRRLLANFRDLTPHRDRPRRAGPTRPEATRSAAIRVRHAVVSRALPTAWSDEAAFAALFAAGDHAYWLDSSRADGDLGRFSIMGNADGPRARVATADVATGTVTVRSAAGTRTVDGPFLGWLDEDLAVNRVEDPGLPCPFALGWVGYLGYELKAECGGEPAHRSDLPDAAMVFADRALVLDHATATTYLLAFGGDEAWLDEAAARLVGVVEPDPPSAARPFGELRARHDVEAYHALIEACQREIAAGESYEVCLTNMIEADGDLDPWEGYRLLRRISPAPFGALLRFGELSVLSTSPERFLRVSAAGVAESRPIKGTRRRGATPDEDAALVADLDGSAKDHAENLMIVDLVRNDLGRCARVGSVDASDVFRVETYAMAHQLVSTVTARLRADAGAVSCVRAAFPPGSMTGAPKVRTMRIIDGLEAGPRGVYSGAIGYFSLTGAADLSVVIRTAVVTPGRVRYGVGGAIIALSDPAEEIAETAVKAAPVEALTGSRVPLRPRAASLR